MICLWSPINNFITSGSFEDILNDTHRLTFKVNMKKKLNLFYLKVY